MIYRVLSGIVLVFFAWILIYPETGARLTPLISYASREECEQKKREFQVALEKIRPLIAPEQFEPLRASLEKSRCVQN